mgnify:FL=1
MVKTAIFYGSDTGNTERAALKMQELLGGAVDVFDVRTVKDPAIILDYDLVLLGTSTWYLGELQSDMENFKAKIETFDFSGHTFALFGLGDQMEYSEFYLNGMGIMHAYLAERGAQFIGAWSTDGYAFTSVLPLSEDGFNFVGLALDEDNQADLTEERIKTWLKQLESEMGTSLGLTFD